MIAIPPTQVSNGACSVQKARKGTGLDSGQLVLRNFRSARVFEPAVIRGAHPFSRAFVEVVKRYVDLVVARRLVYECSPGFFWDLHPKTGAVAEVGDGIAR